MKRRSLWKKLICFCQKPERRILIADLKFKNVDKQQGWRRRVVVAGSAKTLKGVLK
jgi:hypothetical protein